MLHRLTGIVRLAFSGTVSCDISMTATCKPDALSAFEEALSTVDIAHSQVGRLTATATLSEQLQLAVQHSSIVNVGRQEREELVR